MDDTSFFNDLTNYFVDLIVANVEGSKHVSGREIEIRCPYCGDSKNQNHRHLYIKKIMPYPFFCQRCNIKGYISEKFLLDIGINDRDFINIIKVELKKLKLAEGKISESSSLERNDPDPFKQSKKKAHKKVDLSYSQETQLGDLEFEKLLYLMDRLEFLNEENVHEYLNKFRVCLDPLKYIAERNIHVSGSVYKSLCRLNKESIGFLTQDSSFIINRSILKDAKQRYEDVNLVSDDSIKKIYTVEKKIDLTKRDIDVFVAEGVFDIQKAYFFLNDENENQIFTSPSGKNYNHILKRVLYLGFDSISVNIIADNFDLSDEELLSNIKGNDLFKISGLNKVKFLRNSKGKDFGDLKSKSDIKTRILRL